MASKYLILHRTLAKTHASVKKVFGNQKSRQELERLIDQTDIDDENTLGRLAPIASELRAAQSTLEQLSHEHTA